MMEINVKKGHVSGSEALESYSFGFKVTPKAFHLMISQLYKDPNAAFIRELSTNAYEAHQMTGNENEPFEVSLPHSLNPSFEIRDFGPGLTPEQIAKVYTMLFESTKTDSNDMGGCFGLGSKSPFAYDIDVQFGVISWVGGIKYCYAVFKDAEGYPKMDLLHKEPSNERSGVKISIPIKRHDFSTIDSKARSIYQWFSTTPKLVSGGSPFVKAKASSFGSSYSQYREISGCHAKMGNILYKIDDSLCNLHGLGSYPIVVEFPIGQLTPEPSREGLSYDKVTKRNIEEAFKPIKAEMVQVIQKEIDKSQDYFEACWKGIRLIQNSPVTITELTYGGEKLNIRYGNVQNAELFYMNYNLKFSSHGSNFSVSPNEHAVFINIDKKCAWKEIIKQNVASNKFNRSAPIFICNTAYSNHVLATLVTEAKINPKRVIDVSSLPYTPKPKAARKTPSNKHMTKVLTWQSSKTLQYSWTDSEVDLAKDKGVYVVYYKNKILTPNLSKPGENLEVEPFELTAFLDAVGYKGVVYGIKKDTIDKIKTNPNWQNLLDIKKDTLYNKLKALNFASVKSAEKTVKDMKYRDGCLVALLEMLESRKITTTNADMNNLSALYKDVKKLSLTNVDSLINAVNKLYGENIAPSGKVVANVALEAASKAIEDKFPLVKTLRSYQIDVSIAKELVSYIEGK